MFGIDARARLLKRSCFQSLVPERETVLVPIEQLDSVASSVAKYEQCSAQRIALEAINNEPVQTIKQRSYTIQGVAREKPVKQSMSP